MRAIDDPKRVAWLTKRNERYKSRQPELGEIEKILLSKGGDLVVLLEDEDIGKVIKRGISFDEYNIYNYQLVKSRCHANVAFLWHNKECKIVTGWALSEDGLWRIHSWGVLGNVIYETTAERKGYFGFILDEIESKDFFDQNIF